MATTYKYNREDSRLFIALRENGKRYKLFIPQASKPEIDGKTMDIDFVEQGDYDLVFAWNNKKHHCELVARDQNKITVKVNGVEYKYSIESIFSYVRRRMIHANTKIDDDIITAPMPGKIIEVFMAEGDIVNAGDAILTLEAMKMQNEITATCNGVIKKIRVNSGQSVMKDELLVELQSIEV